MTIDFCCIFFWKLKSISHIHISANQHEKGKAMAITVVNTDDEKPVYVQVAEGLRPEMRHVFELALSAAEKHLLAAQQADEPLSINFAEAVKAVKEAAEGLQNSGQIPNVGGNSPGEDDVRNNAFSLALLSAYGFAQTPHKTVNPHSVRGFESLQPLANLMHLHCIYT